MPEKISRRTFLQAGAGVAAMAAYSPAALLAEVEDVELSFIQVSDTHVSNWPLVSKRRNYNVASDESIRRCRSVVKAINECTLPYELIVHTGDVAHTRHTAEDFDLARDLLRFGRETYYVPGNHDVGYSETDKYRPVFEKRFGRSNQPIEPAPGLRFALFDSQPLDPRAGDAHRQEAFRHLDRILTPPMPTIFFCHVMGIPSFHVNQLHRGWPEGIMRRWTERMKEGGVLAVLAGHFHRDEHHVIHGIPFYLAEPVINFWGRQTTYRHWRLSKGLLTYRTVYLEI
jgi:3',5'-cyclic AMP phosphodiesterase CpdA